MHVYLQIKECQAGDIICVSIPTLSVKQTHKSARDKRICKQLLTCS